jgi:hypothetical protein
MEPNLRDAAQRVVQEERRKIRLAKIEEITKAWDDLFFVIAGEKVFKKTPGDYSSFEKSMRKSLEEANQHHLTEAPPPIDLFNNLGELLSVDYVPPRDGKGMAFDLIRLREYYRSDFFFPSVEMALDLSLCKLIGNVKKLYAITSQKGERDLTRTKKSTKAKKEETDKRKDFVIAIYEHGKAIEVGTKLYKACIIIRKKFEGSRGSEGPWGTIPKEQKKMPTPSLDSIKRWLIEAGIRDRDFKLMERYWTKQT